MNPFDKTKCEFIAVVIQKSIENHLETNKFQRHIPSSSC